MPRTKGATNKRKTSARPRKQRPLAKAYAQVEANQIRIIARPYQKPPSLFYVSSGGVFAHKCEKWDTTLKERLVRRGFSVRMDHNTTLVFEKTVARKDSQ